MKKVMFVYMIFADQYQAVPESERFGMFADIGQEISDTQSANLQLRYNYNKSTTKMQHLHFLAQ
jgi:hypothetical protein